MKREGVVVGMSGGVDSSTAAWMLKEKGYRVVGVTLRFYCYARSSAAPRACCSDTLLRRARQLSAKLGIEHHVIDAENEFSETVVRNFVEEYRAGRTPNPCIVCNERVKFPALARVADWLGCERIATGHYARAVKDVHGKIFLAAAFDERKDQSYFLYRVPVKILKRTILPLGETSKDAVVRAAAKLGYRHEGQRESQDVCFLPDGDLRSFLRERIGRAAGDVVDHEGHVLGKHEGVHLCTIGQRKGFSIAGGTPLYVADIDPERNRIVLAPREHVYHTGALCGSLRLRCDDLPASVMARVRYRRPCAQVARVERAGGLIAVGFREPQWAVTPGQSLVFYANGVAVRGGNAANGVVVGGGIIEKGLKDK